MERYTVLRTLMLLQLVWHCFLVLNHSYHFKFTTMKILLLAVVLAVCVTADAQTKKVYNALSSENVTTIDEQLKSLANSSETSHQAYAGTLLMKKAGLVKGPSKKLKIFKEGRKKLEHAIETDKNNGEYRFLRLMIQENAPDILGYNKEIEEDAAIVQQKYASLSADVKDAIQNYKNESKILKSVSLK